MFNITQLLKAAEYIERREREAEHGYASTLPAPDEISKKNKSRIKKTQGNRSTHNELEKNRRAHLRHCLEKLKDIVPLGGDCSRHTTLGLLTKARGFIKILEDKDRKHNAQREQLRREHRYLQRRLDTLVPYRVRQERSISECSTSTNSTTSTNSESCESDEVDILGYHSESDDYSSIQSGGSDGCCSSNRLSISIDSEYMDSL